MLYRLLVVLVLGMIANGAKAQVDKEERKEEQADRRAANQDKVDNTVFRRQILALPEFSEERRKLSAIRKQSGGVPKIFAVVDSMSDNPDPNLLKGYITLTLADNVANVYEVTFDRRQKKIVKVKPTGEALEAEKAERSDSPARDKKPVATQKKKKDDDEDDEEEEEEKDEDGKPERNKKKNTEDDDD